MKVKLFFFRLKPLSFEKNMQPCLYKKHKLTAILRYALARSVTSSNNISAGIHDINIILSANSVNLYMSLVDLFLN